MTSTSQFGENAGRAAATYGAAADHYIAPAVAFWDRFGAATVRRLALPAAQAVGPGGRVLGAHSFTRPE
jgi:hypothetical protein